MKVKKIIKSSKSIFICFTIVFLLSSCDTKSDGSKVDTKKEKIVVATGAGPRRILM